MIVKLRITGGPDENLRNIVKTVRDALRVHAEIDSEIRSSWNADKRPKKVITVSIPLGTKLGKDKRLAIQQHLANVWGINTSHNYQISVRILGEPHPKNRRK